MTDYLILGGGLTGCALASRLKRYLPSASVTLVEAGPDEHNDPLLTEPMGTMQLHNSRFQYNYKSAPQRHYDGREAFYAGGKVLSGSSSVNYASWTRGDRADYDLWAKLVNDDRWSYEKQLPYFRRTEHHHDSLADPQQHGFEGPIHTTPAHNRKYPLTEKLHQAYLDIGIQPNPDHNGGNNKGMAPHVENWRDGKRQPAGIAYGLDSLEVLTNSPVKRVILEASDGHMRCVGAELVSGKNIHARKEVILCCGSVRTPQVLFLSGIGPAEELQKHGLQQLVDLPEVGRNAHDHYAVTQFYRIKNPEKGLCAPHPLFNHPSYIEGFPTSYLIAESAPVDLIKAALESDGETVTDTHPHIHPPRSHYELLPMYAPTEVPLTDMNIPLDGSIISIGVINLLPTSRGTITLKSADPSEDPIIDPNYFATNTDRAVLRAALRRNISAFETEAGRDIVESEVPPPGYPPLTSKSTDEELDARVRRCAASFYHLAGTASMGKVVDTECRVLGVEGLRVADASVLPTPISAHIQVALYALAEQMAEVIASAG